MAGGVPAGYLPCSRCGWFSFRSALCSRHGGRSRADEWRRGVDGAPEWRRSLAADGSFMPAVTKQSSVG